MIINGECGTERLHCPRCTDAYCARHPFHEQRVCIYECTLIGGQLMHKLQITKLIKASSYFYTLCKTSQRSRRY